jgi:hypothetical protein
VERAVRRIDVERVADADAELAREVPRDEHAAAFAHGGERRVGLAGGEHEVAAPFRRERARFERVDAVSSRNWCSASHALARHAGSAASRSPIDPEAATRSSPCWRSMPRRGQHRVMNEVEDRFLEAARACRPSPQTEPERHVLARAS